MNFQAERFEIEISYYFNFPKSELNPFKVLELSGLRINNRFLQTYIR